MNTLIRNHETRRAYIAAGQLDKHPAQVYASDTGLCVGINIGLVRMYVSLAAARELAAHLNAAVDQMEQDAGRDEQGG